MTPQLPIEIIDKIVENLYDDMFENGSLDNFVTLCLISHRYKSIMYQRRKPLMQTTAMSTHWWWMGFSAYPFKNPYTRREEALLTELQNLFQKASETEESQNFFAKFIWQHKAWLDQQLVPNVSHFVNYDDDCKVVSRKTGPLWPGCCVLGDVHEYSESHSNIYEYGFVLSGRGIFFLDKREYDGTECFDFLIRVVRDIDELLYHMQ